MFCIFTVFTVVRKVNEMNAIIGWILLLITMSTSKVHEDDAGICENYSAVVLVERV